MNSFPESFDAHPADRTEWSALLLRFGPALLALAAGLVVVTLGWQGVDQAAQAYRVHEVREHGLVLWDVGWYGGNYPLGYSVLFPVLGAIFSMPAITLASAALAAWSFDRLLLGFLGARPFATWYFAFSTILEVSIGQLPFLSGEALGLAALVAITTERRRLAVVLGIAATLCSPLAGAFLAMGCLAWAARLRQRRRGAIVTIAGVMLVILASGLAFPGDGPFPFPWTGMVLTELLCLTVVTPMIRTTPVVRFATLVYGLATLVAFIVPNPLGGNAPRLGTTIGVPLLACFLAVPPEVAPKLTGWPGFPRLGTRWPRLGGSKLLKWWTAPHTARRWQVAGLAVLVPFVVWQWAPGRQVVVSAASDPASQPAYYQPLLQELHVLTTSPVRIEIPPTKEHWEAAYVAPHVSLARGWERQLDVADNPIFYQPGALTPTTYLRWLDDNGVSFVALPSTPLDYAGMAEARLLNSYVIPNLTLEWSSANWQLWRVVGSPGLVSGPARITALAPDQLDLQVTGPGTVTVRVRYTTYWKVETGRGCVSSGPQGWTILTGTSPGPLTVATDVLGEACKKT